MPAPIATIEIPEGELLLRDSRTGTSRAVTLQPFRIGRTPVTLRDYPTADATRLKETSDADGALPAHGITWFEAIRWCNAASESAGWTPAYTLNGREVTWNLAADGFRLPTEAEWEWACRAGSTAPTYGLLEEIAWTSLDNVEGPQPVATKTANAWGLFDTLGNVWEWCWDYADPARYGNYRSLRGGGWADPHWSVRASVRRGSAPDAVIEDVGFRVARGAVGEAGSGSAQGWSADNDVRRSNPSGPLPVGWTPLRL